MTSALSPLERYTLYSKVSIHEAHAALRDMAFTNTHKLISLTLINTVSPSALPRMKISELAHGYDLAARRVRLAEMPAFFLYQCHRAHTFISTAVLVQGHILFKLLSLSVQS